MHRLKPFLPGADVKSSHDPIADLFHSLESPAVGSNTREFSQPLSRFCHALENYQEILNALKLFPVAEHDVNAGSDHAQSSIKLSRKELATEAFEMFEKLKTSLADLYHSCTGGVAIENPTDFRAHSRKNRRVNPMLLEIGILEQSSELAPSLERLFRELPTLLQHDKETVLAPNFTQGPLSPMAEDVERRCNERIQLVEQAHELYLQVENLLSSYKRPVSS